MLFLLTQFIAQDVDACETKAVEAQLLQTFPSNGSLAVPLDAVIRLEFGAGRVAENMDFVLRQDEVELEIKTDWILHNSDILGEPAVVEITPADALAPHQDFILELDGTPVLTFLTANEMAKPVEDIPSLIWVESYFYDNALEGDDECAPSTQTDIYLQFDRMMPEYSVVINRIPAQEHSLDVDDERDPFYLMLDTDIDYLSLAAVDSKEDEAFCFEVAYVNEAGVVGAFSAPMCASEFNYDHLKCGTGAFYGMMGCSTMPAQDFAWMSLALGLIGLARRRT